MNRQELLKLAGEIYVAGYNRTNPIPAQDAVRAARSLIACVTLTLTDDAMLESEWKERQAQAKVKATKLKALDLIDNS
jgi:hypothetical protein